ncbi:MAG: UvrD-helicase domain-containing protein [Clostridia bacterium]|nr:UvrD-helicase domain-containing protein [Clostridia bacterium]
MEVKWNKDQLKAIEGRGGTVLVSAAAGSGKTAVLVERIIRRLCDTENPVSIENFLIVTFTRAAAAQMREKIQRALKDRIAADPDNAVMRRNLLMLPYANICTIDSFCINLVRENFHKPEISPDFQIADNSALVIYEDLAANNTVAAFH